MDQYRDSLMDDALNPPSSATPYLVSPTYGIRTFSADQSVYQSANQSTNYPTNQYDPYSHHSINQSDSQSSFSLTSSDDDNDSLYEEDLDTDDRRVLGCISLRLYNILVLSIGLMFLFAAFNTLQSWVTNLLASLGFANLGNWSLGVLYVSVCVALFGTPPLVARLGHIRAIIIGALCYLVYIASLIHIWEPFVLIASAINGFGASLLWVAIGGFLTRCSAAKDRGLYTGIFWSIFQLSGIGGNIAAFYIFNETTSTDADGKPSNANQLFIIFTCLATFGTLLLFALRKFPSDIQAERELENERLARIADPSLPDDSIARPTSASMLKSLWQVATSSTLLYLSPAFLFQGIEFSFWNGEFPQLVDASLLGVVMVFAGVGEAVGGLTMGALSDRIGRSLTWMMGSILFTFAVACMYAIKQDLGAAVDATITIHTTAGAFDVPVLAFIAAFCFGLADSAINTQIYAILGNKYKKQDDSHLMGLSKAEARAQRQADDQRVVAAFTYFNFQQNIGAAIGFIIQPLIPVHGVTGTNSQLYLNLWLMVLASVGFTACDRGWVDYLIKPSEKDDITGSGYAEPEYDNNQYNHSSNPPDNQPFSADEGTSTPVLNKRYRPVPVL